MSETQSTAANRALVRWYAEKNPGVLVDALKKVAHIVENMDPRLRELAEEEIAREERTDHDGDRPAPAANGNVKGKQVNARMLEEIMNNPNARGWTAAKWASHLKCAKSSVIDTPTWKALREHRETLRAERAKAKRRRPKASELRHD